MSDRLTLYILHRVYLTPQRIAHYQPTRNPAYLLCASAPGSFYYLIWACPIIQTFWLQVIRFLHDQMGSPIALEQHNVPVTGSMGELTVHCPRANPMQPS